jgi:IS5 family transposase
LAAVNAQLQAHGLMVAQASGAVIDATLVASAARPRSQRIIESEDAADAAAEIVADAAVAPTVTETLSADPDATWLKKGKKSHFGFRSYASVDAQDGYVRGVHTAPANQSETTHFKAAVKSADFKPKRTYADKGFASAANREHLRGQGIKSAIMHKAQRNKPLTQRQRNANKAISKTRYIVEQCFGTMKRIFGMTRASYMGTEKVNAQFTIKAMCFNLLKAANKICLIDEPMGVVRAQCAK